MGGHVSDDIAITVVVFAANTPSTDAIPGEQGRRSSSSDIVRHRSRDDCFRATPFRGQRPTNKPVVEELGSDEAEIDLEADDEAMENEELESA